MSRRPRAADLALTFTVDPSRQGNATYPYEKVRAARGHLDADMWEMTNSIATEAKAHALLGQLCT